MKLFNRILDAFKLESTKETEYSSAIDDGIVPDGKTVYFQNGKMYKVYPDDKESWYDARYLVSDGILYDLENLESIKSIKIPQWEMLDVMQGYGVTGSLDYVIRMKAGNLHNRNEKELCSACLWKSTELMFSNKYMRWRKRDFDRIVNWHYELGMPEMAEKAKAYLMSHKEYTGNIFDQCAKEIKTHTLEDSKKIGSDLVAFHDYGTGCCAECAKMRGRVYSISGKSKIFPKLPDYVKEHGNFHPGCRCSMSLFSEHEDEIFYKSERVNAKKASKRPWKDDRDEREKRLYEEYLQRVEHQKIEDAQTEEYSIKKGMDRNEYEKILKILPSLAPKSLTGYRRMKTMRSKNFMKLYDMAKENGIEIKLND